MRLLGTSKIGEHLQLGEAHVHAIDIGDDEREKQKRHDAPGELAVQRYAFGGFCGLRRLIRHSGPLGAAI
jgi:hypothetical protein